MCCYLIQEIGEKDKYKAFDIGNQVLKCPRRNIEHERERLDRKWEILNIKYPYTEMMIITFPLQMS